jgi:hypothetical protein
MTVALALALIALTTAPALAGGPTDILKVDEFIDAPRVLFGDSLPDVLRILGPPSARGIRARETFREPIARREVERLTYPDLWVELRGRLVGAEIIAPARRLPWGLDVGASRVSVRTILGDAQEETDDRVLYLYSDGFPKTVTFHFRDGRVWRINWEYWVE